MTRAYAVGLACMWFTVASAVPQFSEGDIRISRIVHPVQERLAAKSGNVLNGVGGLQRAIAIVSEIGRAHV